MDSFVAGWPLWSCTPFVLTRVGTEPSIAGGFGVDSAAKPAEWVDVGVVAARWSLAAVPLTPLNNHQATKTRINTTLSRTSRLVQ
ncbi:MAG: hypothetical protein ACR2KG_11875 [Nocardioidaceae bacterium]